VQDDGTGFDEHLVERGNGLASMRRRAHQAGGSLVIASTPNDGTVVTFTAPLA
jgi:signal transduction histidine kinase